MTNPSSKENILLWQAIRAFMLDVPVMRSEIMDGKVVLYLYGGQVVTWSPVEAKEPPVVKPKGKKK